MLVEPVETLKKRESVELEASLGQAKGAQSLASMKPDLNHRVSGSDIILVR